MVNLRKSLWGKGYQPKLVQVPQTDYKELVRVGLDRFTESAAGFAKPVYFIVASVELGNTTTKCILTATNLREQKIYLLNKTVRLTKEMRSPLPGEEVFGETVWKKELTVNAVKEFIRDTLLQCLEEAKIDKDRDLHFVVRSTGVTAGFATPEEVGAMIHALAQGCLAAGISSSKMVAPLTKEHVPKELREYSLLDKVPFDGSVAGSLPPRTPGQVIANEMEAELSTAGLKMGARWIGFDFRNPVVAMDFGTTLKGRITDKSSPYAQTVGSIAGLGGAIPDALVQGAGLVDAENGSVLEARAEEAGGRRVSGGWEDWVEDALKHLRIMAIPPDSSRFGTVPVNPKAAREAAVFLIGCDIGVNGSNIPKLRRLGEKIRREQGLPALFRVIDALMARVASRIVELAMEAGLIGADVSIGLTGRAGITGEKPQAFLKLVDDLGLYPRGAVSDRVVFVEDALALGAGVMSRCMFSLGTPKKPLGGRRGEPCILAKRMKYLEKTAAWTPQHLKELKTSPAAREE
ncbi:methanogenesis marker 14 protein [Candidatus Hecatella orcuttiae]|uniref:methanogenesis marker 14 protein n=1 Tax=Candidatus Hecatella orcuttiae TaxID=1935119 RepID=UPI0028681351|nr:methanogenesis marker 14 protein [Candidatus Hecatella orcuttiae]